MTSHASTEGEVLPGVPVKFGVLGPLEITAGSKRLELGGTRQETVAAMLLLSANRVVTMDRLLEAIYGEDLPPTSRSQAQISISSLRRTFAQYGRYTIIQTAEHGYLIKVDRGELDSQQFEELAVAARTARDAGQLVQAAACYRDALRLWRGAALDGIDSQLVQVAAARLAEQRMAATEDLLTLELDLGRHHEVVGELTGLVQEFPLRERLRGHLMLALYRCGRTAEALEVFRLGRGIMIDELGIEPGERLQELERAILSSDPALQPPAAPTRVQSVKRQIPSLLPTDIADFTGRAKQISQISQYLTHAGNHDKRLPVPIAVITGQGGVGKTSLAIHASQYAADDFPDGQLFADLHGGTSRQVSPMQVLERFLRALGLSGAEIPEGLDERAEVYRNLIADHKILVVLDDAASESQVASLIPGTGFAAVVITSRNRLTGLAGAIHIDMDVFDPGESMELLARIAGIERVQTQSDAAAAIGELCGHLPLALRIAGARLSARPHWGIQQLVDRLADETRRLDELKHGDMGVRPSISFIYESVSDPARRLFRRLALLDVPYFPGWLSAALLDQPVAVAEDVLDCLVVSQLVEPLGSEPGVYSQYRFHDLIHVFARERLAAEEPAAERTAALERALGALLYLAESAHRRYFGGDYVQLRSDALRWKPPRQLVEQLVRNPLEWYERQRAALVAGVRQAAQAGFVELSWGLASSAVPLFESRIYLDDWRETHSVALQATRKTHSVRGEAAILYSTGSLHMMQKRLDLARQELDSAVRLFQDVGDVQGVALVTRHLGYLDRLSGQFDDAARRYEKALTIFRQTGDKIGTAYVLHGLAHVNLELNEPDSAKELLADALRLCRSAQCRRIEAQVLYRMGEAHLRTGEPAEAASTLELALAITTDIGDLIGEAYARQGIGVAKLRLKEFGDARSALRRALELAATTGERLAQGRALCGLGELALANGNPGEAVAYAQQAVETFGDIGAIVYRMHALVLLSETYAALGDADAANAASTEAGALRTKLTEGVNISSGEMPAE